MDPPLARLGVQDAVLGQPLSVTRRPSVTIWSSTERGLHVWGVEAAGVQEADGHADGGADEGGEGLAVGGDEVAALAAFAFETWVGEVEDEVDFGRGAGRSGRRRCRRGRVVVLG
jgi:hypothetical protein